MYVSQTKKGRWYLCWEDREGRRKRRGPYSSRREAELAGVELQYPLATGGTNYDVYNPRPCRTEPNYERLHKAWLKKRERARRRAQRRADAL